MRPVLLGLVIGIGVASVSARRLVPFLFQTSASDGRIYLAIAGAMIAVGVLACYVPARRAGRCDPDELLRM